MTFPTRFPEANALVDELLRRAQTILRDLFVGMYLFGSLTGTDFDEDSDIDVLIVTEADLLAPIFVALQTMHQQLANRDSYWAVNLEVSYIPRHSIRHYDPNDDTHPHLDRGKDETLQWLPHGSSWIVQRYVLYERGIALKGPVISTLIDPVSPDDLRVAMLSLIREWAAELSQESAAPRQRGGQSYIVLSMCRILYTLETGEVGSKRVAARWAQKVLDSRWSPLIDRTWDSRHHPGMAADAEDVVETIAFVRYTFDRCQAYAKSI